MPIYDFKCRKCSGVFEKIVKSEVIVMPCELCPPKGLVLDHTKPQVEIPYLADRMLSVPGSIRMADMATLNRKRQRITEPVYRFPDGHVESVN